MSGNIVARLGGWPVAIALGIAVLWAAFWTWFGLASGIGEGLGPLGVLMHTLLPGLVFLAVAAVAWRWHAAGGWLLVAIGLAVLVGYPLAFNRMPMLTIVLVLLTMAVPPLVAGSVLLVDERRHVPRM